MIQKSLSGGVLVIALGLGISGLSQAQNAAPNTSQNQPSTAAPNQSAGVTPNTGNTNNMPNAMRVPRPNQRAQGPAIKIPAEFQPGVAAMVNAKSSLEKAGDKWGGHRVKAIHLIDQALLACGQRHPAAPGEMKSGPTDLTQPLEAGMTQLTNAKNLFSQATDPWGGRRDKAISFMNQALQELQTAIAFEKNRARKPANPAN